MRNAIFRGGLLLFAVACSERPPTEGPGTGTDTPPGEASSRVATAARTIESNPLRNAYFGDTHIHTVLSVDAYLMGTRRTPDDAYEFAKGAAIEHASGWRCRTTRSTWA